MPAGPSINITNSLRAGIQREFMDMWRQKFPVFQKQQEIWMRFLPWVNLRTAPYVWKESIPFPEPWPYDSPRTYKTFSDILINIGIFPYDLTIPFSGFDEEDDQLGDVRTHLALSAQRFLQIPDKLISEYLTGVASLNFELLNAYDGVTLYSATDGDGAARFGVTGGNIVTGTGLTAPALLTDYATAQRRLLTFQDTTNDSPIFAEEDVQYNRLWAIIPASLNEEFKKMSKSQDLRIDLANNTSQSNWILGEINYRINPYLTGDDWYIVVEHPYWKPFACRMPGDKGIRQIFADFNNSDRAREYNQYAVYSDVRIGIAPWQPAVTVKINN